MAIFSLSVKVIGRSAGRSATAAAAYRSGEIIVDERTGQTFNYSRKNRIYASEIFLPANAPQRLAHRSTLWNEIEQVEKRKDSQLCNEVMIALPRELNHDQKQQLTREYVNSQFVAAGMIADIAYHDFESENPHAHILLSMRSVTKKGFGKKQRDWNKKAAIQSHRKAWAETANQALAKAGSDARIDHRSLKDQRIEREAQIHLGAQVIEMEKRGVPTRIGDEWRRIEAHNREVAEWETELEQIQLALASNEPFYQCHYQELVDIVERKLDQGASVRDKDLQLAMLALRSGKPDTAKALVFSPDVQRLKQEQGEPVAMDYLRQLMESAQQRLKQMDQVQQARQEQQQKPDRDQPER